MEISFEKNEVFVLDDKTQQNDAQALLKRRILHPFTLAYKSKEKLCYSRADTSYLARLDHSVILDRIILRASSADMVTTLAAIKNISKEIEEYDKLPKFTKVRKTTIGSNKTSQVRVVSKSFRILQHGIQIV